MKDITGRTSEDYTWNTNITSWIPKQDYADAIIESSLQYGEISGKAAVQRFDKTAGTGQNVIVRIPTFRNAQWNLGQGQCLSVTSQSVSTYVIQIKKMGDYDELYDMDLWQTPGPLKETILNEMAKGLAARRDWQLWDSLVTFGDARWVAMTTHAMKDDMFGLWAKGTANCCMPALDLYNTILKGVASMRRQAHTNPGNVSTAGYNPDTLILGPFLAMKLKYRDHGFPVIDIITDEKGRVTRLPGAGLNVIEYTGAPTDNDVSRGTVAIIIDSSRALGEAWGKQPEFYEDFYIECGKYKEVVWSWWGCHVLDTNAVMHIRNSA